MRRSVYVHEDDWNLITLDPVAGIELRQLAAALGEGATALDGVLSGYGARAEPVRDGFAFALTEKANWDVLYGTAPGGVVAQLALTFGTLEIAGALQRLGAAFALSLRHHGWDLAIDLADRDALDRFLAGED